MNTTVRWSETSESAEGGVPPPVNSVAFSPQGDYVVVSSGIRVLVYAASTGTLIYSLKGHQDTIYSVSYSSDGKRIASGGADNTVIVWSSKGEGIVKYQHKASIQVLAQNPVSNALASVSSVDWGLWEPKKPKVGKLPLPAKGLSAAWTQDGRSLAIGMVDGTVMILEEGFKETARLKRNAPIWTLAFNPIRENGVDVLAVGSWDKRLSFYGLDGAAVGKERELPSNPCGVSFFSDGRYMLVSGTDRKVALYTTDGNRLVTVAEAGDWVWSAKQRPHHMQVCCGSNDGSVSCIDINVSTVHSMYHDQYIYRENMTDVVVRQLALDRKMTIHCNDYVKRLATYRDRLAVHFEERIVIFELFYDDERRMRYHDIAQIRRRLECSLLCVTNASVVVCLEKRLTLYDFQGNKRREWSLESEVRYIRVVGGQDDREVLLAGLENGQTLKVFIDNPFPTPLVKVNSAVRCVDLSSSRMRLAVVDETDHLQVFDLSKKKPELLFSENNVTAAAFNSDYETMLAYSTNNNVLNIKTGSLPPFQQTMRGIVIGFKANNLFNLHGSNMMVLTVPHSYALCRYIEQKEFQLAYEVACLGVTEGDWKMLGLHAISNLELDIASRAVTRIHEVRLVELLNALKLQRRQIAGAGEGKPAADDSLLLGEILAFQGRYQDAARHFLKNGNETKAVVMFTDLKMWEDARKVCSDKNHLRELIRQQARWAEESENFIEAAALYEKCEDFPRAITMMGQAGQMDKLMKMCRALPKSEVALITECAQLFKQHDAIPFALEAYERVGDNRALIQIYVELRDWRSAFAVLDKSPELARDVYLPWASWLAENDLFEEALAAFRAAKWPQEALRMMETLASNSVTCRKFTDASFYYINLAEEHGQLSDGEVLTDAQIAQRIRRCNECVRRADIYYAFAYVYTHATQPLPYKEPVLFRLSRYLLAVISEGTLPMMVGKAEILYSLARVANRLDMVRTARAVLEKLQTVILPLPIMEQVDVETLLVRSKPFTDRDEFLDTCYRCKQVVPQLTDPGDRCPNCAHPFVRSFIGFEALPLVEFTISNDLSHADAARIIETGIGSKANHLKEADENDDGDAGEGAEAAGDKAKEWNADTGANVITFGDDNIDFQIDQQLVAMGRGKAAANKGGDIFFTQLQYVTRPGRPKGVYTPYVANEAMIKSFRADEVFVVKPRFGSLPVAYKYYRLVNKDARIVLCAGCQHFFRGGDYEYECMKGNGCPLCRYKPERQESRSLKEIMLATTLDSSE